MRAIDLLIPEKYHRHWQMSACERLALVGLLKQVRPALALEIGTYQGGSLQVIADHSARVVSIDIDPGAGRALMASFPNVEFRAGDSRKLVPDLVVELNAAGVCPEFILVDADHTAGGVKSDIDAVLGLRPTRETFILVHDSFNPDCRKGILEANWAACPFVSEVEVDLVCGDLHLADFDTARRGEMWSGLACAVLSPEPRTGPLVVRQSGRALFDAAFAQSAHAAAAVPQRQPQPSLTSRVVRRVRRLVGGA